MWRRPSMLTACLLLAGIRIGAAEPAGADAHAWAAVNTPTPAPAAAIGSYANGCLSGAVALPPEGTGYQVIRLSRGRFYGHPDLIDVLERLGQRVAGAGLGIAVVGDLSQPRGGPMPFGHASHQTGLDADIWLRLDLPRLPRAAREDLTERSMIDPVTRRIDPAVWSEAQETLIRLAADDRRVARIFVAPGIKLALCNHDWSDRSWLRKVRPWFGHTGHLHLRLHCPNDGSIACRDQEVPPPGDGCGAELQSWLDPPQRRPPTPRPPPALPAGCAEILKASGAVVTAP